MNLESTDIEYGVWDQETRSFAPTQQVDGAVGGDAIEPGLKLELTFGIGYPSIGFY